MAARFRYLGPGDREVEIATTDELVRAFTSGRLTRDTLLYDAYGGGWAPARTHSALLGIELPDTPPERRYVKFTLADAAPEATEEVVARLLRERESFPDVRSARAEAPPPLAGVDVPPSWEAAPVQAAPVQSTAPRLEQADPWGWAPHAAARQEVEVPSTWAAPVQQTEEDALEAGDHRPWLGRAQEVITRVGPAATWAVGATLALLLFMVVGKSANGSAARSIQPPALDAPAATPVLSALEDAALEGMVAEMDAYQAEHQIERVPSAWLEGIYLADAGRFPDVLAFWERYGAYIREMQGAETRLFQESLTQRLASEGLSESLVSMRTARALRTFREDEPRRADVYERLLEVTEAAIELHELLVEHEDEISYEPAAPGVSREPITEAVPENREVASDMNRGLDRLFRALEAAYGSRITPRDELPLALRRGLTSNAEAPMR